ncbi:nicotinate phosphoribosyltransferase [Ligilactobacillus sp. WC1T17]|uniref:Nicotinate phosphoribosyltransferase n=1 Tax=Ligilactobacillus ruminis TaxID=1623 RepID=A0ABY1A8Z4_9LACO|nr:nicotinate phosphoribosyltransferase [Ligilactobacillus ruminis]
MDADNWALVTDLYELTMANGFQKKLGEEVGIFDIFFRKMPDDGSFVVLAGMEQALNELKNFHFEPEDIEYLKGLKLFTPDFIDYLADFKFACKVWAVREGTPIFPREPVMTIEGPLIQAQLFETLLLSIINHETLIATKARRITAAAKGRGVMEFGARRAQGPSSATYGARAAVIGGATSTSNLLAAKKFNIPAAGTMAHSWIEAFDSEYDAFRAWADIYPDNCALLADTYDVLESGVPNAIRIFKELKAQGHSHFGIRIDSGDVTELAKAAREMLDEAGFSDAKITISNALDEYIITSLLEQEAPIDNFGVGEKMITSSSSPVLSGVYKLAGVIKDGQLIPKIKVSESKGKLTLPGIKQTYRLIDKKTNKAFADLIALRDEDIPSELVALKADPLATKQKRRLHDFMAVPLQKLAMDQGEITMEQPDVFAIQKFSQAQLALLPLATKRLLNADEYPVFITPKLYQVQQELVEKYTEKE